MNGARATRAPLRRRVRTHAIRALPLLLVIASASAAPLAAQRGGGRRGGPQDRAELEERFRRQMARLIQERLELSDEESQRLSEVVRSFDGPRRELARAEQATRRRVEALTADGNAGDTEARQLLGRMIELRKAESQLFEDEQTALLELLTPIQVLQLQSMREQLGRRIRSLRGRGEEDGRRRGPGGGRWPFP